MKNEYLVTKKIYMQWANDVAFLKINRPFIILFSVISAICALGFTVYFVCYVTLCFTSAAEDHTSLLIGALAFLLLLAISLFRLFFERAVVFSRNFNRLKKLKGADEWTISIEFNNDNFRICSPQTERQYEYSYIKRIEEGKHGIWIQTHDRLLFRIYEDAFDGTHTWEECKALINNSKK